MNGRLLCLCGRSDQQELAMSQEPEDVRPIKWDLHSQPTYNEIGRIVCGVEVEWGWFGVVGVCCVFCVAD